MIIKLIVKYRESASPLLLRELRLVLSQSKFCFWEVILPLFWLFYLIWGLWITSDGSSRLVISCSHMLCWLTAVFIACHYLCLAPRLAASVCYDRSSGIYKMLNITPSGCSQSLIFKIMAFSAPYWVEWLLFSLGNVVFCFFTSVLNAEIALAASIYSLLSLMTAVSLGTWWGVAFQNMPDKCAASLRKLLLMTVVGIYCLNNFFAFSQIETVLVLCSLLLILWSKSVRIFLSEISIILALLAISLSFVPAIGHSSWPLGDCLNPIRVSLVGMYALDREALQTDNLASSSAYPILREHLTGAHNDPTLRQLLNLYGGSSQVSREQIYAQVRSESELYLFRSFVTNLTVAAILLIGTCLMLASYLRFDSNK